MVIQCPDCQTKMTPKPRAETAEGTRVKVTCRCGTVLRFRMPGTPKADASTASPDFLSKLGDMFKAVR